MSVSERKMRESGGSSRTGGQSYYRFGEGCVHSLSGTGRPFMDSVPIKTRKGKDGKRTYSVYVPCRGQTVFWVLYILYPINYYLKEGFYEDHYYHSHGLE